MALGIAFVIFLIGLWWCIKYNQDKRIGIKRTDTKFTPNYRQMIAERKKVLGNSYPTKEDIQKKYPKRKSAEQQRRETEILEKQKRLEYSDQQQSSESFQKEKDLLALVRDRKTCERLLSALKKQYPNQTRLWIIEKAIADIERDRRAY